MGSAILVLPLLLLLGLAIVGGADMAGAPVASPPPAGWTPVTDVNDQTIQQVGHFAVLVYRLSTGTPLTYVGVLSGQTQPYNGGSNYKLVVAAAGPGGRAAQYSAFVWGVAATDSWKLWSFTPV